MAANVAALAKALKTMNSARVGKNSVIADVAKMLKRIEGVPFPTGTNVFIGADDVLNSDIANDPTMRAALEQAVKSARPPTAVSPNLANILKGGRPSPVAAGNVGSAPGLTENTIKNLLAKLPGNINRNLPAVFRDAPQVMGRQAKNATNLLPGLATAAGPAIAAAGGALPALGLGAAALAGGMGIGGLLRNAYDNAGLQNEINRGKQQDARNAELLELVRQKEAGTQATPAPPFPPVSPITPPPVSPVVAKPVNRPVARPTVSRGTPMPALPVQTQMPPQQAPPPVAPEQPASPDIAAILAQMSPEQSRALDVASALPGAMPASEQLNPSEMLNSSPNNYGYESILDSPQFSEDAMMGGESNESPSGIGGFLSKLGNGLVDNLPGLIQAYMMYQGSRGGGGVRDWQTGLTFGAPDPTKSLGYQQALMDMQERSAQRQAQLAFGQEMLKQNQTFENTMYQKMYENENSIAAESVKAQRGLVNDLIKEGSIDTTMLSPEEYAILMHGDPNDPLTSEVMAGAINTIRPDVKDELENVALEVYTAAQDDPKIKDTKQYKELMSLIFPDVYKSEQNAALEDKRQQNRLNLSSFNHNNSLSRIGYQGAVSRSNADRRYGQSRELTTLRASLKTSSGSTASAKAPQIKTLDYGDAKIKYTVPGAAVAVTIKDPDGVSGATTELLDWDAAVDAGIIPSTEFFNAEPLKAPAMNTLEGDPESRF